MTNSADEPAPTDPPPGGTGPGSTGPRSTGPGGTLPPQGPTAGGYATRFHLARPDQGRYIAGVCAALGRATNTDPVLWRVILPVLTLFNGLGAVLYLAGVLLIPNDGDTGSPLEALAGRGRSRMSRPTTVALLVLGSIAVIVGANHIGGILLIGIAVVAGIALLAATRGGTAETWPTTWPTVRRAENGFTVNWPAAPPAAPTPANDPSAAGAPTVARSDSEPTPGAEAIPDSGVSDNAASDTDVVPGSAAVERVDAEPAWMSESGWPAADPYGAEPVAETPSTVDPITGEPARPSAPAYQEPFAPFGPYAASSAYPHQFPGLAPTTVVTPPPFRGAKVKVHSPVRRITVSAALLVVGFLGIIDLAGVRSVPAPMYFAAALATIGIGMFIGSFFGRVRGPITLGILLAIGLMVSATAGALPRPYTTQTVRLAPTSVAAVQPSYVQHYGTFTLDLSHVPFTKTDQKAIDINMKFGQVTVILPPDTYTSITAHTEAGDLTVLDQNRSGINTSLGAFANADDQGKNGAVTLNISITAGDVEVRS